MRKRSVCIAGRETSISLEKEFWDELWRLAARRAVHVGELIAQVDRERKRRNLSSALRVFVLRNK